MSEEKEKAVRATEVKRKAQDALNGRQQNYLITFNKESPTACEVLRDLADFCRANETTHGPDIYDCKILEGRRQVWLRINEYLNLSTEELWELRTKTRY